MPSAKFPQSPQLEGSQENLNKDLFSETIVITPPPTPPVEPPIPPATYPGGSSGGCLTVLGVLAIIITLILLI